jgi:predicted metal-dependent enzyme (double-stranded beta helix superfamily)
MGFMKKIQNRLILFLALTFAGIVGILKGHEAKQKWVFKVKSRYEEKRHLAQQKKMREDGGVALDDIEIASFHKS